MKKKLFLLAALALTCAAVWGVSVSGGTAAASQRADEITRLLVAREKASVEAWQRKDKAFFADLLADDATYFNGFSPYLDTDAKQNFLPKFEQYAEAFKFQDFQIYNPRAQVYGDTAVLTYNSAVNAVFNGQPLMYTAKMTVVYVRQGDKWRVVHGHESMNPMPR